MMRLRSLLPALLLALPLAGCLGLDAGPRASPTIYAPPLRASPDPAWPTVAWSLSIAPPEAPRMLDLPRIAVIPEAGELQVYKGALWADTPTQMLEDSVLYTLEDSGRITAVARQGSGINADYRLGLDIRHFEADFSAGRPPTAVVEVQARLMHLPEQQVVGSQAFRQTVPAAGDGAAQAADALGQALRATSRAIAGWALATGQAHQREAHAAR